MPVAWLDKPATQMGVSRQAKVAMMLDPFAEVGKWLRVLSGVALGAVALLFALAALVCPIAVLVLWLQGEREAVTMLAISIPVYAVLATVFFWLARRLLRGTRSPNAVTVLPLWFIQVVGVLMLLGLLVQVFQAEIKPNPQVPRFPISLYAASIPIITTMITGPWLLRRRPRSGMAGERGSRKLQQ
jgi:hypothetical protein